MKSKIIFSVLFFLTIFSYSNLPRRNPFYGQKMNLPILRTEPARAESININRRYFYTNFTEFSEVYDLIGGLQIFCFSTARGLSATAIKDSGAVNFNEMIFYSTSFCLNKNGCYSFKGNDKKYYISDFVEEVCNIFCFELTDKRKEAKLVVINSPTFDLLGKPAFFYTKEYIKKVTYLSDGKEYNIIGEVKDKKTFYGVFVEKQIKKCDRGTSFIDEDDRIYMIIRGDIKVRGKTGKIRNVCFCREIGS